MAFNLFEVSTQDSAPIELYTFARGAAIWRFTSSDVTQIINGFRYEAVPMKRSYLSASQELQKTSVTITLPQSLDFARQFLQVPPSDVMSAKIQRYHIGDSENEIKILWLGRISNLKFKELSVEVFCEPTLTSFKRPMLRRFYQLSCPHILYGEKCAISLDNWKVSASVDSFTPLTITSSTLGGYANNYFTGGIVFYEAPGSGAVDKRFITNHSGDTININMQILDIAINETITFAPGCNHSLSTCNSKFNNLLNFGGCPYIPEKNPMNGTPIF